MRVASAVIVAGVVLATPATARAEGGETVMIHHYQYEPGSLVVAAGTAVTWTNEDTAAHDVATTSGPTAFQSGELATGRSFTYTFTVPGTYQYLCTVHPDMVAALTVTAAPTTSAPPTTAAPPAAAIAPVDGAATTTTTTTAAVVGVTGASSGSELSASPVVPAASIRTDDLASSSRPYLALLAIAAALVVGCLLLLGVGRRGTEA